MWKTNYPNEIRRYNRRTRRKSNPWLFTIWAVIILLAILGTAIGISWCVSNTMKETDAYWGSVIGGIVSGVFTYIGVLFTVYYYKRADKKKDIIRIRPFFYCKKYSSIDAESCTFLYVDSSWKADEKPRRPPYREVCCLKLTNVGNGMAYIEEVSIDGHDSTESVSFQYCYAVNDSIIVELVLEKNFELNEALFISFYDSDYNEYIQGVRLRGPAKDPMIQNMSPVCKDFT